MSKFRKTINRIPAIYALLAIMLVASIAYAYRPYGSSTLSSADEFRHSSRFAANYVFNRTFIWIPMTPVQISTTDGLVGIGGGAPTYVEIGTSEAISIFMDTDNDTASTGLVPFPTDTDFSKPIQCRVLWSQSQGAATGTVNWTLTYEVFVAGVTAISVPNDAFDVDGGAQADLGAAVLQWGPYSTIAANTITATPGDDLFAVLVKYTEDTLTDGDLYGVQCRLWRKWLGGGNS